MSDEEVRELVRKYTGPNEGKLGGRRISARYYIDFKRCTSPGDVHTMALVIAGMIQEERCHYTGIAAPNIGVAFAPEVAYFLRKPFYQVSAAPYEGYDFAGETPSSSDELILISDVHISGDSLRESALNIRETGAGVKHAFILVERTDASLQDEEGAREVLAKENVQLHARLRLSDEELEKMYHGAQGSVKMVRVFHKPFD